MILGLNALPAQSQITGFDKVLRARAIIKDIYVNLQGMYSRTGDIPNGIYMKVDDKTNSNSVRITLKQPLTGMPVLGNARLTGNEEAPSTKAATIYRGNYKKAVRTEGYGVRYLDQQAYGLYKEHIGQLSTWAKQYEGLEIRQAILERYGLSLTQGDTATTCVQEWNPHFYVQGCPTNLQPVYSSNSATYTNRIVAAMIAAGGLGNTPAQTMMFRLMNTLGEQAFNRRLYPLMINGVTSYVFVISQRQAAYFTDPTYNSGASGGAVWIQAASLPDNIQKWYNIIGKYQGASGYDIYVVVDQKCPTLIPSGTAAPYGLRAGYMWMGDVDRREYDNPNVKDACFLLGQMAITNWDAEALHFIKQDDDYWRIMGNGIAGVRGIQQVQYDQQNPDATSREYYGSMVVVCGRPNYV